MTKKAVASPCHACRQPSAQKLPERQSPSMTGPMDIQEETTACYDTTSKAYSCCVSVYLYIYTYTHIYNMCVYMYMYIYNMCVYMYMYIYIYVHAHFQLAIRACPIIREHMLYACIYE